ncbi:MAG: hypothetical protein AAFQ84_01840 [Pseudomonadota bacterium]
MPKLSLSDQEAALKARLAEVRAAQKAQASKRHQLIGAALMSAADSDPALKAKLATILDAAITKPSDRKLLDLPWPSSSPSSSS